MEAISNLDSLVSLLVFLFFSTTEKVADFYFLAILIQYSSIACILKCKDFGTESNKDNSNTAHNQLSVLFTCEMRKRDRAEDLSKPEMTE